MQIKFEPNYTITPKIMNSLMRIEAAKSVVKHSPIPSTVLAAPKETAKIYSTHYSTRIEGNTLSPEQVKEVVKHKAHFSGYERDEQEVKGYYTALTQTEQWAAACTPVTEKMIQTIHALVMADGEKKITPTAYRNGQNIIMNSKTRAIVYMPPKPHDVPNLMSEMVAWINKNNELPCPIIASIAHYQFATIHPYFDGNGRTARLLTMLILNLGDYDLKSLYVLEEYYVRNLGAYYDSIRIGESHNYYQGRAHADITRWIEYLVEGMAIAFEDVVKQISTINTQDAPNRNLHIRKLNIRQRKTLELFQDFKIITSSQIGQLFELKPRTSAKICAEWVENGFLGIVDSSNKRRTYKLSKQFEDIIQPQGTIQKN